MDELVKDYITYWLTELEAIEYISTRYGKPKETISYEAVSNCHASGSKMGFQSFLFVAVGSEGTNLIFHVGRS
jgi:hypothetical protein